MQIQAGIRFNSKFNSKEKEIMGNLVKHAEHELSLIPTDGEGDDDCKLAMNKHILGMVRLFAAEGHSGFSANYAINILRKLLRFEPLTPLTGDDSEWRDCDEYPEGSEQNKRCGRVFRDKEGRAYDVEGKVFCEPSGASYTGKGSEVDVTFPYTPKTEYVQVKE